MPFWTDGGGQHVPIATFMVSHESALLSYLYVLNSTPPSHFSSILNSNIIINQLSFLAFHRVQH